MRNRYTDTVHHDGVTKLWGVVINFEGRSQARFINDIIDIIDSVRVAPIWPYGLSGCPFVMLIGVKPINQILPVAVATLQ